MGPVINEPAAERIQSWVDEAVAGGARVLTGGTRSGTQVAPTLLMIGDHEVIYPPRAALSRAQVLIPHVETELVENTGHLINIEQAGLTDRRLSAFLAAHAGIGVSGRSGSAVRD